jgi:hypothetical protein
MTTKKAQQKTIVLATGNRKLDALATSLGLRVRRIYRPGNGSPGSSSTAIEIYEDAELISTCAPIAAWSFLDGWRAALRRKS